MTFTELKGIVGAELEARLTALFIPNPGLYYDEVPANYERLFVRFWFPFDGLFSQGYNAGETVSRPLLQVDVRHFPPAGSTATTPPALSERVWEALKLERLPGVGGCKRQPDGRAPLKDAGDHSRWGWHRFMLYV